VSGAKNFTSFMCRLYINTGSLNFLDPYGPVQALYKLSLAIIIIIIISNAYKKCKILTNIRFLRIIFFRGVRGDSTEESDAGLH
jgi:hypothetical protein